jgi:hypothetical protein
MKVVFDDALAAPPAAAATESTSRTRFMLGSFRPRRAARPPHPRATAVPIVSKKSDSITAKTGTIAVQNPRVEKNPNEKFPRRLKSGVAVTESGTLRDTGPDRVQDHVVAPDPVDDRRDHGGGHDPAREAPPHLPNDEDRAEREADREREHP